VFCSDAKREEFSMQVTRRFAAIVFSARVTKAAGIKPQ